MAAQLSLQSPLASRFLGTVQSGGLTNPYGLAAVYSTGKHESSWSPKNVYGEWGDPSESGEPGRAGGALSWRADRLNNLRKFAKSRGDDPRRPSVETQADFFLSEDPSLIGSLQAAKNPVEAQRIMDNAWRFAGYDRPGGEAARRLRTTREILGELLGGEAGAQRMVGSGGQYQMEDTMAIGGQQSGGAGEEGFLFPTVKKPESRSQLLAMVLENMQRDSQQPNPQSWPEAGARALTQGIQGYMAGNVMRKNEADEQRQREMLAGFLQGNPQAVEMLNAGIGDVDDWQRNILKQEFKEPEALPTKVREAEYYAGLPEDDPRREYMQPGRGKPSDREQRVQMMVDNGTPPEIATGIATGQFVVRTNPYSQQPEVVNLADGQVVFDGNTQTGTPAQSDPVGPDGVSPAPGAAPQGTDEVPPFVPEGVDPTDATGASGFFGGIVNQISDMFGQGLPFHEIEEASEALNTTQILTMSLLQAEVPGRPSQYLLQKLEKLTVSPNSLLRADERAVKRLKQTRDLIKGEVDRIQKDVLSREHEFKPGDMTKARLNSSQLKSLLKAYDAMLGTVGTRRDESKPGLEQFDRRRR